MSVEVGAILDGKVVSITGYGAFIALPDGKTGMVHISEVADTFVKVITDHIQVNSAVKVKVLAIDSAGKISLSIRHAMPARQKSAKPADVDWKRSNDESSSFEERLNRFTKESEDRLLDVKRNREHRRGGSRAR